MWILYHEFRWKDLRDPWDLIRNPFRAESRRSCMIQEIQYFTKIKYKDISHMITTKNCNFRGDSVKFMREIHIYWNLDQ